MLKTISSKDKQNDSYCVISYQLKPCISSQSYNVEKQSYRNVKQEVSMTREEWQWE